jgi:hypothetical protein
MRCNKQCSCRVLNHKCGMNRCQLEDAGKSENIPLIVGVASMVHVTLLRKATGNRKSSIIMQRRCYSCRRAERLRFCITEKLRCWPRLIGRDRLIWERNNVFRNSALLHSGKPPLPLSSIVSDARVRFAASVDTKNTRSH